MTDRPSWKDYFTEIVQVTKRSPCNRLKVGCILVKDNRIISQGYNGFISDLTYFNYWHNHEVSTIHAEQNAIIDYKRYSM